MKNASSMQCLRLQRGTGVCWLRVWKPEASRADDMEMLLAWCSVMGLNLKPSKGVSEKAWFSLWASAARATTLSSKEIMHQRNRINGNSIRRRHK